MDNNKVILNTFQTTLIILSIISCVPITHAVAVEKQMGKANINYLLAYSTSDKLILRCLSPDFSLISLKKVDLDKSTSYIAHLCFRQNYLLALYYHGFYFRDASSKIVQFNLLNKKKTSVDFLLPKYVNKIINFKYSNNSKFIAFIVLTDDKTKILIYEISTKAILPNIVTRGLKINTDIVWSRDDKNIIFISDADDIVAYDYKKDNYKAIAKGLSISVDYNNSIFYTTTDDALYKTNLTDFRRELIDKSDWSWNSLIGFSPDNRYLFYIGGWGFLFFEAQVIKVIDLHTKIDKKISDLESTIYSADLQFIN